MELSTYVRAVQADLVAAAELGDEELRSAADRLARALDSSIRLRLQELLTAAAHELDGQIDTGRVDVHLAGEDVALVYTGEPERDDEPAEAGGDDDASARITLRLPERIKVAAEQAATAEGISTNAWLQRAVVAGLKSSRKQRRRGPNRLTGYAES